MILAAAVVVALAVAVLATLVGGRVSNTAIGPCAGYDCPTIEGEFESYGWPIPWRIDKGAADEAEIGTGGVSITSFMLSVALWFWAILAPLVIAYAAVDRRWMSDGWARLAVACLIAFGAASIITIFGALDRSSGVHDVFQARYRYESAGWPIEWKTNPWLWAGWDSCGYGDMAFCHESMRSHNALGYSSVDLAINWLMVAIPGILGLLFAAGFWRAITGLRHRVSGLGVGAASG